MPRRNVPKRGDRIELVWLDISEDSIGDPEAARCIPRVSIAYYWEQKQLDYEGLKADIIVTCNTLDPDGSHQQGWCAYPAGAILGMRVLPQRRK
jgi:hypothetical protein